jgi:hypothetical protein
MFFELLKSIGVRKCSSIVESLIYFLCIDKEYPQALVVAKLAKAIEDFPNYDYFKSFGTNRRLPGGQVDDLSEEEEEEDTSN